MGHNPRKVARAIRGELGGNLVRALRISRTEQLRAYREATRRNYQANSDIIAGWRWLCAKQSRTCAMCLAMDGSFHTNDEHLDDHPNGRCAMVPVLKGEENKPASWETGSEWLAKQSPETQAKILGHAGAEAYRAGAVKLTDYVGQKTSKEWGSTRYARSLRDIVGAEEAKKWREVAQQEASLSPAPADRLIRDLIRSGRDVSEGEVQQIAAHMTQADFPTVAEHLARRTGSEGQWATGTTEEQYWADLRRAVAHSDARMGIYERRGGHMLGVVVETARVVPDSRLGHGSEILLFVAYSADRGIIVTGYQISALERLNIPESVRWLK